MTRRWVTGTGWVRDPVSHLCRTCGQPVAPIEGKGRPRLYCDAHAPAQRARSAAWYDRNREHVRSYQRERNGYRATEDRTCPCPCRLGLPCGEAFRGYVEHCPRCRRPEHVTRWRPTR